MSKYFKNSKEWSKDSINITGLPRPFSYTNPQLYFHGDIFFVHKQVPIPWQSKPSTHPERVIDLIIENEKRVAVEDLCGYCGIKFKDSDNTVRWVSFDKMATEVGPRVLSDSHPLHLDCMKQARIFCPHMRRTKETEFEYGTYKELKSNFNNSLQYILKGEKMENNVVKVIDNFITDEQCLTIKEYMDSQTDPNYWILNNTRQMIVNAEAQEIKPIIEEIINKVKNVVGNDDIFLSEYMLSRYNPGFAMSVHTDIEDGREHYFISAVVYLNNDFTGGDIVFPAVNFRHSPKMGQIALFDSDGDNTYHGVETVTSGIRYAMPLWFTNNKDFALKFFHE